MSFPVPGGEITSGGFLAAGIVTFGITGLVVITRICNSYGYAGKLFADDYLAVFAWAFQAVNFGFYVKILINVSDPNISFRDFGQFVIAESFIGGFAIYFAKVPVLVLFTRLFGIRKWVQVTVWSSIAVGFVTFLAALLYSSVECSAGRVYDAATEGACIQAAAKVGVVHGAASLALDIIIFIIPLSILSRLHLSTKKKIGLGLVFAVGIIAIAASAVALSFKVPSALGTAISQQGTNSIILSFVEASIAIIVGCVPAIRSFWLNQLPSLSIYSKIRSVFTTQGSTSAQSASKSLNEQFAADDAQLVQANYIELQETNSVNRRNDSPC
ncbi:hypothetical protein GGS24DRAFT_504563 [Hypoxylon argillaceum]|nr:hypothetical protein GGS24DRAFT_504563 [Hypoxylon argillaceum]